MEKEIYDIILKIMYDQSIKKLYEKNTDKFEYPINVEKVTFDVVDIFNYKYFNLYKEILLKNAAVYAINMNDVKYIDLFCNKNINDLINNDKIVKAMITQRAFYNIYIKIKSGKNRDEQIINKDIKLYDKLNPIKNIESFNNKYRKIILKFLNKYNKNSNELELILDLFLTTKTYDDEIINDNDDLNHNNITTYKLILYKLIISDNYLYLKSLEKDNYDSDYEIDEEYIENEYLDDEEFSNDIDHLIIKYIEDENYSNLINDNIKFFIYSNFITYNIFLKEHKYDIENIKDDKEIVKTLKKINPYYFLDLLN